MTREGFSDDGRGSKPNAPKKAVGAGTMTGLPNVTAFVNLTLRPTVAAKLALLCGFFVSRATR